MERKKLTHAVAEWFAGHAAWEFAKYLFTSGLIAFGWKLVARADWQTVIGIFLIVLGLCGFLWITGTVPSARAKLNRSPLPALKELRRLTSDFLVLIYKFPNSNAVQYPFSIRWRPEVGTLDIETHVQEVIAWHARAVALFDELHERYKDDPGLSRIRLFDGDRIRHLSQNETISSLYEAEGFLLRDIFGKDV